jgi:hypothetical protein
LEKLRKALKPEEFAAAMVNITNRWASNEAAHFYRSYVGTVVLSPEAISFPEPTQYPYWKYWPISRGESGNYCM